jgi:hypothetical protein
MIYHFLADSAQANDQALTKRSTLEHARAGKGRFDLHQVASRGIQPLVGQPANVLWGR